jgi:hypothetical protein
LPDVIQGTWIVILDGMTAHVAEVLTSKVGTRVVPREYLNSTLVPDLG